MPGHTDREKAKNKKANKQVKGRTTSTSRRSTASSRGGSRRR